MNDLYDVGLKDEKFALLSLLNEQVQILYSRCGEILMTRYLPIARNLSTIMNINQPN